MTILRQILIWDKYQIGTNINFGTLPFWYRSLILIQVYEFGTNLQFFDQIYHKIEVAQALIQAVSNVLRKELQLVAEAMVALVEAIMVSILFLSKCPKNKKGSH